MGLKRMFYNTPVMDAVEMLNFSDEDILSNSNGEVKCLSDWPVEEDSEQDPSLADTEMDPNIFGPLTKEAYKTTDRMGHITLPVAVTNINYLYGTKPVIYGLLGMDRHDIERVVYYASYLVLKSSLAEYPEGTVLTEKELAEVKEKDPDIEYSIGAKAIQALMENRGIDTASIILHHIPVLPYAFRYGLRECPENGSVFKSGGVSFLLNRLVNRTTRLKRLIDLGAPEIILRNEGRMIQEYVDSYINNGARGPAVLDGWGEPYTSLQDYSALFNDQLSEPWDISVFDSADTAQMFDIAKSLSEIHVDEGDYSYEEYLENEDVKKEMALYEKLVEMNRPLIMSVAQERYPLYKEFLDVLVDEGCYSLKVAAEGYIYRTYSKGNDSYENDKEMLIDSFFSGVIPVMDVKTRHLIFA